MKIPTYKEALLSLGDAATVTAASGTTIQEFSIDVTTLAMKDVYESRAFADKNSKFSTKDDTIKISIDGKNIRHRSKCINYN